MAQSSNSRRRILTGTAKYKCQKCGHKWKMRNSSGGLKSCDSSECDDEEIQPYDFDPDPWKRGWPKEWRLFGDFHCTCGRYWPSAYTWIEWNSELNVWEKGRQGCNNGSCRDRPTNMVQPTHMRPLLHGGAHHPMKPHLTDHCQKCKELGRDCRNYTPPEDPDGADDDSEEGDIPDDVSVRSDASADDELDDESDRETPVPSDEDTTEDFLDGRLQNLQLANK